MPSWRAMTEILFYHLKTHPLERALPRLLEKTLQRDKRAVVLVGTPQRVEHLVTALWTYRQDSWLPHGSAKDGCADKQPIWLTGTEENPNDAAFIFLTDQARIENPDGYERVIVMFDDRDRAAVGAAREDWKRFREAGRTLSYWQQTPAGGWEKKAEG